jgi:LAO/AO transport system kinase
LTLRWCGSYSPPVTRTKNPTLSPENIQTLVSRIQDGNIRAGSRLMRLLDDRIDGAEEALRQLYPLTGRAQIIGITGTPGSGKSTLVDQLVSAYRKLNKKVGVVAVDPSSPFSGGAILGDRIRMMDHSTDPGVFIRSLATRGQMGGLSRSTDDVVHVFDAMGYDVIIVETVGVGQDEIDIVQSAQTSVVILVPGLGDDIQAIKAGILEIADIFVVNKADREGADRTAKDLKTIQHLGKQRSEWDVPVLRTVAVSGDGVDSLVTAITAHHQFLTQSGGLKSRERGREAHLLRNILQDRCAQKLGEILDNDGFGDELVDQIVNRQLDPYAAADQVLSRLLDEKPSEKS